MKRHLEKEKLFQMHLIGRNFLPIFDVLIRVDFNQKNSNIWKLVLDLLLAMFNANLDLDKIWLNEYKREQFDEYIANCCSKGLGP